MMGKIQQAMQDDVIRTARIHPAVHPGNRGEVLIWQNFQPAYQDLGWKNRDLRPRPHVSGDFCIRKFFYADTKISASTRIRFVSGHLKGLVNRVLLLLKVTLDYKTAKTFGV